MVHIYTLCFYIYYSQAVEDVSRGLVKASEHNFDMQKLQKSSRKMEVKTLFIFSDKLLWKDPSLAISVK